MPRRARDGWRGWHPGALAATYMGLTREAGSRHQALGARGPPLTLFGLSPLEGDPRGEGPVINPISRTCLAQTSRGKQVADEEGRVVRAGRNLAGEALPWPGFLGLESSLGNPTGDRRQLCLLTF